MTSKLEPNVQTVETLTAAISQMLRNIGMGEVVSTKKCKKSTQNSMALSIKEQQAKMTDEEDKMWKSAKMEEVAAFENGGEGPGDTYKLNFNKEWERSQWNQKVLCKIYDKIVVRCIEDGGWGLSDVSEEYLIDLAVWEYFQAMLKKLSCDGMSSEEERTKKVGNINIPIFWVKLCVWRALEISDYLKYIDSTAENEAIHGTKGARMSPRYISDQHGTSPPPKSLPHKMYNLTWLENEEKI
ncbi:hypothetical protein Hypma_001578 [Hypsizygus marmoreus]|uniref:Uncharacterized protein n=1 Tax=Hypsizygus marmoreus TaxID=39966 RepID=A0A369K600_HYPMA|nr:hypothetical protein Hypma_001578 [Hypsizygus marmoreus]